MSNWKLDLDNLEKRLKEEENGQPAGRNVSKGGRDSARCNNGDSVDKDKCSSDNCNGRGSRYVLRGPASREVAQNNGTGKEKVMITAEAAAKDLEEIEVADVTDGVKVVRAVKVLVKFLSTMRSNQLLTDNDKVAIQKAKANRKPEEKKA